MELDHLKILNLETKMSKAARNMAQKTFSALYKVGPKQKL